MVVGGDLDQAVEVDVLGHAVVAERNSAVAWPLHSLVNRIPVRRAVKLWPEAFGVLDVFAVAAPVRLDVVSRELADVQLRSFLQVRVI